jgi:hypothetical protein
MVENYPLNIHKGKFNMVLCEIAGTFIGNRKLAEEVDIK